MKTSEEKKQILHMLSDCWDIQNLYGKTGDKFEKISKAMLFFLKDYKGSDIIAAIQKHVETSNAFPTPADIIAIIKQDKEFPIDCQEYWIKQGKNPCDRISLSGDPKDLIKIGRMKKFEDLGCSGVANTPKIKQKILNY